MPKAKTSAAASSTFAPGDKVRALYGDWGVGEVHSVKVDPKRAEIHRQRIKVRFAQHDEETRERDLPEFSPSALAAVA